MTLDERIALALGAQLLTILKLQQQAADAVPKQPVAVKPSEAA